MTNFTTFEAFDEAYKFSDKAGFKLSEIQVTDVERFLTWERSLNTYSVGCGKTVVSTVVALMRGNPQKLVLVPPILITPWSRWLRQVSDGVVAYEGSPKERAKLDVAGAHWVVMSFDIFRRDFDLIESKLNAQLEVIVDEAHALKNADSVLFRKVNRLL